VSSSSQEALTDEDKALVVELILRGRTEEALRILSEAFKVEPPRIRVGLPKGRSSALGVYDPKRRTIWVRNQKCFSDPRVVLHEFYHHIRFFAGRHRGTEKHANQFVQRFLEAYVRVKRSSAPPKTGAAATQQR